MDSPPEIFATCPKGIESLLAEELRARRRIGADARPGVAFAGNLATGYRACLWSRLASRVLLPLAHFPAPTPEALYAGVQTVCVAGACRARGHPGGGLPHRCNRRSIIRITPRSKPRTRSWTSCANATGVRPSVDYRPARPAGESLPLYDEATVSIDLSGESLHRRGYHAQPVEAPLKEKNLAAAILLRAQWPAIAKAGGARSWT